jgi:hypothetical protein
VASRSNVTHGGNQFQDVPVPTSDFYEGGNVHLLDNAWLPVVEKGLKAR